MARIRDTAGMSRAATRRVAPQLAAAIERSADPRTAETVVERLVEARPELGGELAERELVRDGVVALACASRSLSSAFIADPSLLDPLRDENAFRRELTDDDMSASWQAWDGDDERAVRRWKRRQLLRIAARDLLGAADLPSVGRELASLASVALDAALRLTSADATVAIVGMGKLGGRELNYSSDVDVLFVHDGDTQQAERAAREVLTTMSAASEDGIVFRTDANLRPEGRSGPLDAHGRQLRDVLRALGPELGIPGSSQGEAGGRRRTARRAARGAGTRPFVWPESLDPDAVREIRAMKERAEAITGRRGLTDRELKRGRGGIRDIEFAVQLLQLVHGRHDESVRSPDHARCIGCAGRGRLRRRVRRRSPR